MQELLQRHLQYINRIKSMNYYKDKKGDMSPFYKFIIIEKILKINKCTG